MKRKPLHSWFLGAIILLASAAGIEAKAQANFNVVPRPLEVKSNAQRNFMLDSNTLIVCNKEKSAQRNARHLQEFIRQRTGLSLRITRRAPKRNAIVLTQTLRHDNAEAYRLIVDTAFVRIDGASPAGTFYGIQTLRKALPHNTHAASGHEAPKRKIYLPETHIADHPRFAYRGAHLDVARHFITPDSVRRFIDMIALHNINRFHWHLTDDQGWRIEIKKHPRLTEVGSRRKATVIGRNTDQYDNRPYGGWYTQEECRAIVEYAAERHITVIPEIDLPGHMLGALAAYPELGCTGGPYEVWTRWGVSDDVLCAGNPRTYDFIDDVLAEIVNIFPSTYIHVGGDECPKARWEKCPKCQALIKREKLFADEKHSATERLQSYVIRHAERTLNRLGRKVIGWDETLEGGLAPGATVMSWRGEAGGLEAARSGHDAIMSPNSFLYFDYYQTKNTRNEPLAIGGYIPLKTVYGYEPVPDSFTPDEARRIIGVQANLWTEYIPTFRQAEYMELPRMAALAEVQWTPRGTKNYDEFISRLPRLLELYREQRYNFAKHVYDVTATYDLVSGRGIVASFSTIDNAPIRYTLDGTDPTTASTPYTAPLVLTADTRLRAAAFRNLGRPNPHATQPRIERSNVEGEDFRFSLSTAKDIKLLQEVNPQYRFAGAGVLVDGLQAENTNFRTGRWIGFHRNALEAVIDLGTPTAVKNVAFNACIEKGDWIYGPRRVVISISDDGTNFRTIAEQDYPPMSESDPNRITAYNYDFPLATTRFVKVLAIPESTIPAWHTVAAGKPAFLFVDEIIVR